jgi:hypothetical protein
MCRREHKPQAQIDKIDIRDAQYNVAGDHHTASDHAIDEIDQGDLLI